MRKLQSQGVHHITLVGADRQTSIDFWEGLLGMPFVFEQPNLDVPEENHLYFDAGDGRLITFFVRTNRATDPTPVPEVVGNVHHIAYEVSRETYDRAVQGLEKAGYPNTGAVDRGFMDSLYFRDPNGFLIELSVYKFEPPPGHTRVEVLALAHKLRVAEGAYAITTAHCQRAVEQLAHQAPVPVEEG